MWLNATIAKRRVRGREPWSVAGPEAGACVVRGAIMARAGLGLAWGSEAPGRSSGRQCRHGCACVLGAGACRLQLPQRAAGPGGASRGPRRQGLDAG